MYIKGKGKEEVHPRTGYEGPEGEQKHRSNLSLTSALDCVGGKHHASAALLLGTHCKGDWVGTRASLDGWGKPQFHRDSIPGPSSP
jgi:hypothetical protein